MATGDKEKVASCVHFGDAFVENLPKLVLSKFCGEKKSLRHQVSALFHFVIKVQALRDSYLTRQGQSKDDAAEYCCKGCREGPGCQTREALGCVDVGNLARMTFHLLFSYGD